MANIKIIHNESARGCGYRKPGGIYLRGDGLAAPCGKLPLLLHNCPTCSAGIKFARGWTWIDPRPLFAEVPCYSECQRCPANNAHLPSRAGLLWIGREFYSTAAMFELEAEIQGVSRRIAAVPRGFKVGETWVYLAHVAACTVEGKPAPGIFRAFRPSAIEYIVKGTETEAELDELEARGLTLVKLVRSIENIPSVPTALFDDYFEVESATVH